MSEDGPNSAFEEPTEEDYELIVDAITDMQQKQGLTGEHYDATEEFKKNFNGKKSHLK